MNTTEMLEKFIGCQAHFFGPDEEKVIKEQDIGLLESVDNMVTFRTLLGGIKSYPTETIKIRDIDTVNVKKRGRRISLGVHQGIVEIE